MPFGVFKSVLARLVPLAIPLVCCTEPSLATQGLPISLESTVRLAAFAFAGTVDSLSYRKVDIGTVTDVHFSGVRYAKGHRSSATIVLTVRGGKMGGRSSFVVDAPTFEMGNRYIVLAGDQGTAASWYLPVVGLYYGFFRVVSNEQLHRPIVHDWAGRPLLRVAQTHIVVLSSNRRDETQPLSARRIMGIGMLERKGQPELALEEYPPGLDPGTRVTEEDFLQQIERIAGEPRR